MEKVNQNMLSTAALSEALRVKAKAQVDDKQIKEVHGEAEELSQKLSYQQNVEELVNAYDEIRNPTPEDLNTFLTKMTRVMGEYGHDSTVEQLDLVDKIFDEISEGKEVAPSDVNSLLNGMPKELSGKIAELINIGVEQNQINGQISKQIKSLAENKESINTTELNYKNLAEQFVASSKKSTSAYKSMSDYVLKNFLGSPSPTGLGSPTPSKLGVWPDADNSGTNNGISGSFFAYTTFGSGGQEIMLMIMKIMLRSYDVNLESAKVNAALGTDMASGITQRLNILEKMLTPLNQAITDYCTQENIDPSNYSTSQIIDALFATPLASGATNPLLPSGGGANASGLVGVWGLTAFNNDRNEVLSSLQAISSYNNKGYQDTVITMPSGSTSTGGLNASGSNVYTVKALTGYLENVINNPSGTTGPTGNASGAAIMTDLGGCISSLLNGLINNANLGLDLVGSSSDNIIKNPTIYTVSGANAGNVSGQAYYAFAGNDLQTMIGNCASAVSDLKTVSSSSNQETSAITTNAQVMMTMSDTVLKIRDQTLQSSTSA